MNWLSKFILSAVGHKVLEEVCCEPDPTEENVGIHLLSDYGNHYEYISEEPTELSAVELINSLDWEHGFFQVIVTLASGLSMEVGGSLNGVDGLSGVYRNRTEHQQLVTSVPPESTEDMVEIIKSFIYQDGQWKGKYQFN